MEEVKAEILDDVPYKRSDSDKTKLTVAVGFLIAGMVFSPLYFFSYYDGFGFALSGTVFSEIIQFAFLYNTLKVRKGTSPNTIFGGVACLILGNLIAGILRLCCKKD